MRLITFLSLFVAAATGAALYLVSQQVQSTEAQLRQLNRDIVKQEEALHVLRAEWSYLNTPGRLKKLAAEQTDLKPMAGEQIAHVADLPERPAEPEAPEVKPGEGGAPPSADALDNAPDMVATLKLPPLPKHKPRAPVAPAHRTITAESPVTIKTAAQEKPATGPAPRDTKRQFDMLLADLTEE